jgi:hypothetical protein
VEYVYREAFIVDGNDKRSAINATLPMLSGKFSKL